MTERVRVAVRVRPRNTREAALDKASLHTLDVDADHGQVFVCKKKNEREVDRELRCAYDRVFGPLASQDDVFAYVQDAVAQVAQGFNCTIFAYGQTGTGKTHTMLGKDLEQPLSLENPTISRRDEWGVIPRAIEKLFEEVHALSVFGAAAIVHCSYIQLYNNDVFDLLQTSKARMKDALSVREMIKGNAKHVYVSGLSEFRVTNVDEAMALLHTGNKHRTIRATEYNERSSRSHALLQLSIEVESRGAEGAATILRRAKLNLVDLAGSEKWDTDVSMGTARCKELTSINQSLSALGNVIAALTNPKRSHIPYRDSKLTRLLQDSLGGNTRTVVLATISEDVTAIDETISTLSFADRAKSVVLRVQANEMVDDAVLLAQAQREIARLKLLLKKQTHGEDVTRLSEQVMRLSQENAALVRENKTLKQKLAAERKKKASEALYASGMSPQQSIATKRSASPLADSHSSTERMQEELDDGLNEEWRHLEATEQSHARELAIIQTERRELERELERLEQETPRQANDHDEDGEDERCPMCGRVIDDHNDQELDDCIERETTAMVAKAVRDPSPKVSRMRTPQLPTSKAAMPTAPPARLGRQSSSGDNNKPSPYMQEPWKQSSPPKRLSTGASEGFNEGRRPSTALSHRGANSPSQKESSPSYPSTIPILRQGSKSVKALKTFHATSPYNVKTKAKRPEKTTTPSPRTLRPPVKNNADNPTSTGGRLTQSIKDIGLQLMVYTFRYDCWYPCTVVGYDSKRRWHCCQYEYGDKQWQDLSERKLQLVGRLEDA